MSVTKFRIVEISEGVFIVQFKEWYWPIWYPYTVFNIQSPFYKKYRTFSSIELAESFIAERKRHMDYPKVIKVIK